MSVHFAIVYVTADKYSKFADVHPEDVNGHKNVIYIPALTHLSADGNERSEK